MEMICISVNIVFNVGRVEDGEKGRSVCSFFQAQPLAMISNVNIRWIFIIVINMNNIQHGVFCFPRLYGGL